MKYHVATWLLAACFGVLATPLLAAPAVLLSLAACAYMLHGAVMRADALGLQARAAFNTLAISFGGWFAAVLITVLIHRDPVYELDSTFRFLLAIGVFWIVAVSDNKRIDWVVIGVAAGAAGAAGVAGYQYWAEGAARVAGWTNNPIYFGNFSILLTLIALVVLGTYRKELKPSLRNLLIISLPLSLCASLASMSRSSFLALLSLLVLANFKPGCIKRSCGYIALGVTATLLILLSSQQFAEQNRAEETTQELHNLQNGDYEGSMGQRLQMWKGAFLLFESSPIIGVGSSNYQSRMVDLNKAGKIQIPAIAENYNQPHSGIMDALACRGLIGLIAYLSLFALPYRLFSRLSETARAETLLCCRLGKTSVIAFFIFGLTNSIMGIQLYAVIYPMTIALFAALAINFQNQNGATLSNNEQIQG